ncbi:MAG: hypothetical protein Q4D38_07300 [Planctomycetia bacterium]|nr:hypothetical protein [Planctomycetia bacterium]
MALQIKKILSTFAFLFVGALLTTLCVDGERASFVVADEFSAFDEMDSEEAVSDEETQEESGTQQKKSPERKAPGDRDESLPIILVEPEDSPSGENAGKAQPLATPEAKLLEETAPDRLPLPIRVPQKSKPSATTAEGGATPLPIAPRYRIEETVPGDALMVLRFSSVKEFNACGKKILSELSLGSLGPLDWLRLSAYGPALPFVDRNRQAAVVYFPMNGLPALMLIVPTTDYAKFIEALGADVSSLGASIPDFTVSQLKNPPNYLVYPRKGYAVIVEPIPPQRIREIQSGKSFREMTYFTPTGLKSPHASLEITPLGIRHFSALGKSALSDFSPVFSESMKSLKIPDPEIDFAETFFNRADNLVRWVDKNVQSLRYDIQIKKTSILASISILPRQNSLLHGQIMDPNGTIVATTLEMDSFLKVVPVLPAPVCGQMDVPASLAAPLQAPFNRVRHLEYCFTLPAEGELLAESWCFFLEVDDAQQFVRELIVPNAQKIGSHVASEKLSEIGAQVLGNMAVRRASRQGGRRRPPRLPADPEGAARTGERWGAALGNLVGREIGEKEGMKKHDFMGYPLYVSDLVYFTEMMNEIRAKERGELPPRKPILLTGEFTLMKLIGGSVGGLLNGDINVAFGDTLSGFRTAQQAQPLIARTNYICVLSPYHILIVPGNDRVLHMAVSNWNAVRDYYFPPVPAEGEMDPVAPPPYSAAPASSVFRFASFQEPPVWQSSWDSICAGVVHAEVHRLRSVTLLDPANTQWISNYIRQNYAPLMPSLSLKPLPRNTPPVLTISTTAGDLSYFFSSVPYATIKNLVDASVELPKVE